MPDKVRILKIEVYVESKWTPRQMENWVQDTLELAFPVDVMLRDVTVEEQ